MITRVCIANCCFSYFLAFIRSIVNETFDCISFTKPYLNREFFRAQRLITTTLVSNYHFVLSFLKWIIARWSMNVAFSSIFCSSKSFNQLRILEIIYSWWYNVFLSSGLWILKSLFTETEQMYSDDSPRFSTNNRS